MSVRLSVLTCGLVVALAALPACDKKKASDSGGQSGPPDGKSPMDMMKGGMKMPPGATPPTGMPGVGTPGGQGGQPSTGTPNTGTTPNDPSLPAPPGPLPLFAASNPQARQISQNNLKQIALAFHASHDVLNGLPSGIADKAGNPGLSWRVALLPYLEQGGLYKQFKLDEPWNSEANKKLIDKMPQVYAAPQQQPTTGYTFYRSFSGQGAIMPPVMPKGQAAQVVTGTKLQQITDGTSNTLLVAEAGEPVIWTKPDDLPFSPGKPPKLGGGIFGDGFNAALCDGSVRPLPLTLDAKTLSNMIQINDGQVVNIP